MYCGSAWVPKNTQKPVDSCAPRGLLLSALLLPVPCHRWLPLCPSFPCEMIPEQGNLPLFFHIFAGQLLLANLLLCPPQLVLPVGAAEGRCRAANDSSGTL